MLDSDLATDIADFLGLDAAPPLLAPCAALCDPMSRPGHESGVLSIDCAADLLIALRYSTYAKEHAVPLAQAKFLLSVEFALLLSAIHSAVNAHDDFILFERIAFPQYTPPRDVLAHILRTTYAMACVLIMALHKLFAPPTGIPCLASHPYLHYFINLWKCHTTIISLALQVDRDIEEANQTRDDPNRTPASIKRALAGSSAIRCVLAWILNMNVNVSNQGAPAERNVALPLAPDKCSPIESGNQDNGGGMESSSLRGQESTIELSEMTDDGKNLNDHAADHQHEAVQNILDNETGVADIRRDRRHAADNDATDAHQVSADAKRSGDGSSLRMTPDQKLSLENNNDTPPKVVDSTLRNFFAHKKGLVAPDVSTVHEPNHSLRLIQVLSSTTDDLKCETATDFLRPLVRKHTTLGALKVDMRLLFIGMLFTTVGTTYSMASLGQSSPFIELSDLLYGLEYSDRYDEDIRYIFECEYEDLGAGDDFEDYDPEDHEFDPQDLLANYDHEERSVTKPSAERASNDHESTIDDYGHDWRDVPRGENAQYRPQFLTDVANFEDLSQPDDSLLFFSTWDEMLFAFVFLCHTTIEDELPVELSLGQVVLNTIAYAIMKEEERGGYGKLGDDDSAVTPDRIFHYLFTAAPEELVKHLQLRNSQIVPIFEIVSFELLLHANSKLARCILDEMMMSRGYRRVIIWVLVHNMNLLALHIDYVFELLAGLRGIDSKHTPYTFSRLGSYIELSDIELVMLLHEFFASSAQYLASVQGVEVDSEHTVYLSLLVATKYVTLICLMIDRLVDLGLMTLGRNNMSLTDDMRDFTTDLKLLLIPWIGKVPEARRIYVAIQKVLSLESSQSQLNPEAIFEYSPETDESAIRELSELLAPWIGRRLNANPKFMDGIYKYLKRLDYHLTYLIGHKLPTPPPQNYALHLERDILFFFTHFNTLCKIEFLVNSLYEKFEVAVADIAEFDQWTGTTPKTTEKSVSLKKRGKRKKKSKRR